MPTRTVPCGSETAEGHFPLTPSPEGVDNAHMAARKAKSTVPSELPPPAGSPSVPPGDALDGAARGDAIVVEGLSKHYGEQFGFTAVFKVLADVIARLFGTVHVPVPVVKELTFRVPSGRVVGFLGPNGAGKTTTLKTILRLLRADSGRCWIEGRSVEESYPEVLDRVGAIVERPTFYEYMSARENLTFLSFFREGVGEERIDEKLRQVGLWEDRHKKVMHFSTGMKQRLALAAAILHDPAVLILDEPTSGLDPRGQAEIWKLVRRITHAEGMTVFLSSHILHDIEQMCDYVVILDRGRLIAQGTVAELVAEDADVLRLEVDPVDRAVALLEADENVLSVTREEKGLSVELVLRVRRGRARIVAPLLVKGKVELLAMEPITKTLEEFFLSVTES